MEINAINHLFKFHSSTKTAGHIAPYIKQHDGCTSPLHNLDTRQEADIPDPKQT